MVLCFLDPGRLEWPSLPSAQRAVLFAFSWLSYSVCLNRRVQGGKESLFVAVIDEFYTFDLMDIHVNSLGLEFYNFSFLFLYCILFVAKVFSQEII